MIENVHSHEGEERRYPSNVNYTFKPPKNIKQIGESTSQKKIYVEDYVFTYIKELAKMEYANVRIAVLLGKYIKTPEEKIILINGAVEAKGVRFDSEDVFTNDTWTSIYDSIKQFFHEVEVVGWFIGGPGFVLENYEKLRKVHLDNFAGVDKTLLRYDSIEGEESFYFYEHGALCKQTGYYVYYEKNEDMQNYIMADQRESPKITPEEYRQEVVKEYKEEVKEEKSVENGKSVRHLMYAVGSLMVMIVIVIAATIINNNNKLVEIEKTVNGITNQMHLSVADSEDKEGANTQDTTTNQDATGDHSAMEVETISGNLNSVKDEDVVGGKGKADGDASVDGTQGSQADDVTKIEENSKTEDTAKTGEDSKTEDTSKTGEDSKTEDAAKVGEDSKTDNAGKSEANSKAASATTEQKYYVVQDGDTLVSICYKLYNSPNNVNKIIQLNEITDPDKIISGQKLIVP